MVKVGLQLNIKNAMNCFHGLLSHPTKQNSLCSRFELLFRSIIMMTQWKSKANEFNKNNNNMNKSHNTKMTQT